MKNNLKMFGLALCVLPMYLHAGTGQDLKQASQPTQEQNAGSGATIPAGTILPISLNSTLRSDKSGSGAAITATVMQDVPLGSGETLRKGSKVTGHVVEATISGKGSDESRISFQFDQVQFGNQTIPITTNLRAVASRSAVLAATPQLTSPDYADNQIQIGGDQISYGEGVERVFPLYSPTIAEIEVIRRGDVRRAKLYYLRGRRGKSARIAEKARDVAPKTAAE